MPGPCGFRCQCLPSSSGRKLVHAPCLVHTGSSLAVVRRGHRTVRYDAEIYTIDVPRVGRVPSPNIRAGHTACLFGTCEEVPQSATCRSGNEAHHRLQPLTRPKATHLDDNLAMAFRSLSMSVFLLNGFSVKSAACPRFENWHAQAKPPIYFAREAVTPPRCQDVLQTRLVTR